MDFERRTGLRVDHDRNLRAELIADPEFPWEPYKLAGTRRTSRCLHLPLALALQGQDREESVPELVARSARGGLRAAQNAVRAARRLAADLDGLSAIWPLAPFWELRQALVDAMPDLQRIESMSRARRPKGPRGRHLLHEAVYLLRHTMSRKTGRRLSHAEVALCLKAAGVQVPGAGRSFWTEWIRDIERKALKTQVPSGKEE